MKGIPLTILCSFIYWLAFAQHYTGFVVISWILFAMACLGAFTQGFLQRVRDMTITEFFIGVPFIIFNLWVFYTNDAIGFGSCYVILTLILYTVALEVKSKN